MSGRLKQNGSAVAYKSRVFKGSEKRYSITEKELLAMLFSMEKITLYLILKKFEIYKDHKPLTIINSKEEFGLHRIYRWFLRLSRFDFE